jgi:hypothetical protein
MSDWMELFTPDKEVPVGNINLRSMPKVFQGAPLNASILAFKAFLTFRKIDLPGSYFSVLKFTV